MSGKKSKTGTRKVPDDWFRITSPDSFQEYHVAAVAVKQSPFRPAMVLLLTWFAKAESRQSFFPFGQIRSCWAHVLGEEFPLHSMHLHPFENLGYRQMAFSTSRKTRTEQEFRSNQFEHPFLPLHLCHAIALFPQIAFSLQEQEGPVGLCCWAAFQFPGAVTVVSQHKSLCRRLLKILCSL